MSLKVFDLQCDNGHVFEGWFSVDNSFEKQASQGLLQCPVCGDDTIERKLSAPRLNLGKADNTGMTHPDGRSPSSDQLDEPHKTPAVPHLAELQGKFLQHMRQLVKSSEDVGPRFAQEALKMHHGEVTERTIRGTATPEERRELLEEGVGVMTVPDFLNDDQLQ